MIFIIKNLFLLLKGINEFSEYDLNITIDSFDRIIVSDSINDKIEFFNEEWKLISIFGSDGNGLGQFNGPEGIYINEKKGKLLVCDSGNNRIQIIK